MEQFNMELKKVVGRDCPAFRCSYATLSAPKAFQDNEPEYSVTALIPKNDPGLKVLRRAHLNSMIEKFGPKEKWTKKQTQNYHDPFRDGDEEKSDQEAYRGMVFVRMKAKQDKQPQVFDQSGSLADPEIIYSGCWAKATVIAYAYDYMGKVGGGFALKGIQKVRDDKRFGNADVSSDFDSIDDGSEKAENHAADEDY